MIRPSDAPVGLLLTLFAAAPVFAQWQPVEVAQSPPPRTGFTLLPLASDELLLFGGDVANPSATEWIFDGVGWRPVTLPIPRRVDAAAAVVGGFRVIHGGSNGAALLNDTWIQSGAQPWGQFGFGPQPGPLTQLSMVGDPQQQRVVLIGLNGSSMFETWFATVPGGVWTAGPTFSAPAAALCADSVRGDVQLLLSGLPGFELRRLVADTWQPVTTAPTGPSFGEVAFDPRRGRTVVLEPFANRAADELDGLRFVVDQSPSGGFVPTARTAMAWHPGRSELVLVTNYGNTIETWRYLAAPAPAAFRFGNGCGTAQLGIGLQPGDSPQPGALHRLLLSGANNSSLLTLSVLGLSTAQNGGLPLPQPLPLAAPNCQLLVEALLIDVLGTGLPQTRAVTLPSSPTLLGLRYAAQALQLGAAGVTQVSNGLQVQVGSPLVDYVLSESFLSDANRDPRASGDPWGVGFVLPAAIGGDGRHGSFDPAIGEDLGNGVYRWNTDNVLIPAGNTLDGAAALVTDGRFFFTDFVVPAGITVQFVGSVAPRIFVRGQATVLGTVACDAAPLPSVLATAGPAIGQPISTFAARSLIQSQPLAGQPGGSGGPGGGRGGNGGNKCLNAGPIIVNGITLTDGQPGDDVRLPAGHAYAAQAGGTGGRGSTMMPPTGLSTSATLPLLLSIYRAQFSRGGSGGGFATAGGQPTLPTLSGTVQPLVSPAPASGLAFPLLPFPAAPGYSSLDHFLVGGAGGGGGGCHVFGTIAVSGDIFVAGSAGSGGGGALALRAGASVVVGATGRLQARGGDGVLINGDNPTTPVVDNSYGISSPGGGGSGGSVLVQSGGGIFVTAGVIDTRGGAGSRNGLSSPVQLSINSQAGNGASGYYRFEGFPVQVQAGPGTEPPYSALQNVGLLNDRDDVTGSRSTWLLTSSSALPVYLRYELLVDIQGNTVLFSDDPSVSTLRADDPNGAVVLRFQGGRLDPVTGQVPPSTIGPWRTTLAPGVNSLNRDLATGLRFDLVLRKSLGVIAVRELRIVWR